MSAKKVKTLPIESQKQLSHLLRTRRLAEQLSLRDLSYKLDKQEMTPSQLSRIENGQQWPKFGQLKQITRALNLEICLREV